MRLTCGFARSSSSEDDAVRSRDARLPSPADVLAEFSAGTLGLSDVAVTRARVAGRPALKLSAILKLTRDDGVPVTQVMTIYLFLAAGHGVEVAFGRTAGPADPEFDEIVHTVHKSIRLLTPETQTLRSREPPAS